MKLLQIALLGISTVLVFFEATNSLAICEDKSEFNCFYSATFLRTFLHMIGGEISIKIIKS